MYNHNYSPGREGMRQISFLLIILVLCFTGTALGASLDGRLGLTGKAGAFVPLQDDFVSSTTKTRTGIAAGGGLIFGFCKNFAAEVDVTRVPSLDVEISGSKAYEAALTDVALGVQYRLASENRLVPFFGLGADFIKGSLKHVLGATYNLDWTEGGHVNVGVDYFLTRGIALSAEIRGLFAFDGDVKSSGVKVGEYNPMSFIGTLGVRLMLPESAFW
jgi:outer membrane protein